MGFLKIFVRNTGSLTVQILDSETSLPPSAGCASGRSRAINVASGGAVPRSFSEGISVSAVPGRAVMPAAAQQRRQMGEYTDDRFATSQPVHLSNQTEACVGK